MPSSSKMAVSPLPQLRLAAIDLDGTLLGPDLSISPENFRAVERLAAAGMEVVIASGRHYDSIKPIASRLPGVKWIVSSQGGEVCSLDRSQVLVRTFLEPEEVRTVAKVQHSLCLSAMFYTPETILTDGMPPEVLGFYTTLTGLVPGRATVEEIVARPIHKIVCVSAPAGIGAVRNDPAVKALDLQVVQTHLRLLEFMPHRLHKGTGLQALATHLGLTSANVVAFGDADNDIPMFDWAGRSFAMAHGWPKAKASASHVTAEGPPGSALARAVDVLLA